MQQSEKNAQNRLLLLNPELFLRFFLSVFLLHHENRIIGRNNQITLNKKTVR